MTYNTRDISERVRHRKERFIIYTAIALVLIAASVATMIIMPETTVIFVSVVCIAALIFVIVRLFLRYHPKILFSKEIKGINIKEHEFVTSDRRKAFGYRKVLTPRSKNNFSGINGNSTRTKPPTHATVYLRLENGDVTYIEGLTNAQTDVYEIGDELTRYEGTKYPVITNRDVKKQPCPICGTVNRHTDDRCVTCGLEILQN